MQINFTSRHFKATKRLRSYAEERVSSLSKFYDNIIECDIILDHEKRVAFPKKRAKVTLFS